jgi:hypothetical protein
MVTLRGTLGDAINELNKLLLKTSDPEEEKKIRQLRRIYFTLFEEVIMQEINRGTQEFKEAIDSLEIARKEAVEAKKDIAKIAEAINKAIAAAKAVDRIVNVGIDLFA